MPACPPATEVVHGDMGGRIEERINQHTSPKAQPCPGKCRLESLNCGGLPWRSSVKTLPSDAGGAGSIPGGGAKITHASRQNNQNIKQKQYCNKFNKDFKNGPHKGTSLVAQWLRVRLPMQGTRVQSLVWEDPTCHRSTKPMRHNY